MTSIALSQVLLGDKPIIVIRECHLEDPDLYDILNELEDEERVHYFSRVIRVGAVALQVMETTNQADYVRAEFYRMRRDLTVELNKVFADQGLLLQTLDRFLGEHGALRRALDEHFGERGSVIYKVLNPDDDTTPLGRFRKKLIHELDVDRDDTAFHKLKDTMEDGFEKVLIALGAAEASAEEREKSHLKGRDFESFVCDALDCMARDFEDTVELTGDTPGSLGKVGDVVIHINPRDTGHLERRLVFEVKKTAIKIQGKHNFLKELDLAKKNRGAHYAIGVIHEAKAPDAIGSFRRYDGSKILCSIPESADLMPLEIAYKVARAETVCATLQTVGQLDVTAIKGKIREIQNQLEVLSAVRRALSGATGKIESARDDLQKMEASIQGIMKELTYMIQNHGTG